ncbi:MAG: amidohydrolase family protein [Vicinamibacteria bacterium]|nr:amidohydrolase family protein [Vicinamibacteria bacterium]
MTSRFIRAAARAILAAALLAPSAAARAADYDLIVRGGMVYDGTGGPPRLADVGIRGDLIATIGDLSKASATRVLDARGLAVAPGFINMLSWSVDSLIVDGRSQGEIRQGVTTEIFGEGDSMGPLTPAMKKLREEGMGDIRYKIEWTTLSEYLNYLEKRGISPNVASYIGAATIREHVIGLDDKKATPDEMQQMRDLVRAEMKAGALGIGSSLIYAPAVYADTNELIELSKVAAQYQGKYISHMRSEGDRLLEAVDELIRIAREAKIPAEIYHMKAAGESNWNKLDAVVQKVEAARAEGLKVTADMYTYTAGATGFDACLPPWSRAGGPDEVFKRLEEPATRARISAEMKAKGAGWENICAAAGSPERMLLLEFKNQALKPLQGKTLAEVVKMRGGKGWTEVIMDLVHEDRTRVGVAFFLMSEDNVRKQVKLPWVSFGSDAASMALEGVFLKSSTHPRAYGNFSRLLGRYVRDEKLIPLEEAIRRLAALPAQNLGLDRRGLLKEGMFADVVAFDPLTVGDRATFEEPHQYSVGMKHVVVNGIPVLVDGEHTGTRPGRALWGPGRDPAPARPLPERITVHLAGDSTMADKLAEKRPETGWGERLQQFFLQDRVRVANHAQNGRSTRTFISEGRWDALLAEVKAGDYVFVEFGHNDESKEKVDRYTPPEDFKRNLGRFVADVRAKKASPVLLTPVMRRRFDASGAVQDTHGEYPDLVRSVAAETGTPLIDLHRATGKVLAERGLAGSRELFLQLKAGENPNYPQGIEDNTHSSPLGASLNARLAADGIRELKLPLAAWLR